MNQIRIEYDDDALAILDKVNKALEPSRLRFEDDGESHDGFVLMNLISTTTPKTDPNAKFQPGDRIRCIDKAEDWYDLTIGEEYVVDKENCDGGPPCYMHEGREYVQIVNNDSSEPYTNWFADMFEKVEE